MGTLLAQIIGSDASFEKFLFGYAIMLPAHLGLSYSNNYFDAKVDSVATQGLIYGGSKEFKKYPTLAKVSKRFALFLMVISIIIALFFVRIYSYGIEFIGFVLLGNLLGWFYSAPPLSLSYNGFGEIANMVTMGLLMPGIGFWVIYGSLNQFFVLFSVPLFLYGLQFIITVELPDYETDKAMGKKTLVVRKGRTFGLLLIAVASLSATIFYGLLTIIPEYSTLVTFYYIAIFSVVPLCIGFFGLGVKIKNESSIQRWSLVNMGALITLFCLIDIYFISILWWPF